MTRKQLEGTNMSIYEQIFRTIAGNSAIGEILRTKSIDWNRGFRFSPRWGLDGRLLSIYEESDESFTKRVDAVISSREDKKQ